MGNGLRVIIYLWFSIFIFFSSIPNYFCKESLRRAKDISISPEKTLTGIFAEIKKSWKGEGKPLSARLEELDRLLSLQRISWRDLPRYYFPREEFLNYIQFYLDTLLCEEGLSIEEKKLREAVLLVKEVIEKDDLKLILEELRLDDYSEFRKLIQTFAYDLGKNRFSTLLEEEKEDLLQAVANTLPYSLRLYFYTAFQPHIYEIQKKHLEESYEEGKKLLLEQLQGMLSIMDEQSFFIFSIRAYDRENKLLLEAFYNVKDSSYSLVIGEEIKKFSYFDNRLLNEIFNFIKSRDTGRVEVVWFGKTIGEFGTAEISLKKMTTFLPLRMLIPTHKVSDDIGVGSTSYRRRGEEIDKGITDPIRVLQFIGNGYSFNYFIADGHARALAYLDRGIEEIPVTLVTVKDAPQEFILESQKRLRALGNIDNLRLSPLQINPITLDGFLSSFLMGEGREELAHLAGDAVVKAIVDTVREKGEAKVLVNLKGLDLLIEAFNSNPEYHLYLENWGKVKIYIVPDLDIELARNVFLRLGIPEENIKIIKEPLPDLDLIISDISGVVQTPFMSKKTIVLLLEKDEGLLFNEILGSKGLSSKWDNPQTIIVADSSYLRAILPSELKPSPKAIVMDRLVDLELIFSPLIEEIERLIDIAKNYGHPAMVAIDGWLGSGRSSVVLHTLLEAFKSRKFITINIDSYRRPLEILREEFYIDLPELGQSEWNEEFNIGIERIDEKTIKIKTLFEEKSIKIPPVGVEIKLEDMIMFIKREGENRLRIRLLPALVELDLERFYSDIERIRRGEKVYIPVLEENHAKVIPAEERARIVDELTKMGGLVAKAIVGGRERQLIYLPNPEESWKASCPGSGSFWLDIENGEVLYEINPQDYEIIFITGELTLHSQEINPLYSLRLFVEADFLARKERLVREHILSGFYREMKTEELINYLERQRISLEDSLLFRDRDNSDWLIINNIFPDENFLREIYGMNLSERVNKAVEFAKNEGIIEPWKILKFYVLPVTGWGSEFRRVLEYLIDLYDKGPSSVNPKEIVSQLENRVPPFDNLSMNEFLLFKELFQNIGWDE